MILTLGRGRRQKGAAFSRDSGAWKSGFVLVSVAWEQGSSPQGGKGAKYDLRPEAPRQGAPARAEGMESKTKAPQMGDDLLP